MPNQVGQDDLHTHLGTHWDIRGIELTDYLTRFTREILEQRGPNGLGPVDVDLDALRTDERGRVKSRSGSSTRCAASPVAAR